jgi:hypothetical protein
MSAGKIRAVIESVGLVFVYAALIGVLMYPVWSATQIF